MVDHVPAGLTGLIISALLSAAMSTISSGMNASATVFSIDIYKRYFNPKAKEKALMRLLYTMTVVFGLIGLGAGIAMIGIKSVLDIWWQLSGIFAGGMLGLFLLGIISRQAGKHEALIAVCIGVCVIIWMTFSSLIPADCAWLKNQLNQNMIIVLGTLSIFLTGVLLSKIKRSSNGNYAEQEESFLIDND